MSDHPGHKKAATSAPRRTTRRAAQTPATALKAETTQKAKAAPKAKKPPTATGPAKAGAPGKPVGGAAAGGMPKHPATLAIDIGGTGLKASVLDAGGRLLANRVRVATVYPLPPELLVETIGKLVEPLPAADRGSAGFPGVVRTGVVLTAPHFVTKSGPGSPVAEALVKKWKGFDLAGALTHRLGLPVRVANDADLQGWAVVSGTGLEMVVTLGTGVGSALFLEGKLAPHLELAQLPFRKKQTYNEQIGNAALQRIGVQKWRKRVLEAIVNFETLVNYDRLYIGGGNGRRMAGYLDPSITIVDNVAGILGGIKLWDVGGHGKLAG